MKGKKGGVPSVIRKSQMNRGKILHYGLQFGRCEEGNRRRLVGFEGFEMLVRGQEQRKKMSESSVRPGENGKDITEKFSSSLGVFSNHRLLRKRDWGHATS